MGFSGQLLDITRMQLMLMVAQRKTLKLATVASQLNQVAGSAPPVLPTWTAPHCGSCKGRWSGLQLTVTSTPLSSTYL